MGIFTEITVHIKVKRILDGSTKSQDTKRAAERTGRCEEEGWTGDGGGLGRGGDRWTSVQYRADRRPADTLQVIVVCETSSGQGGLTRVVEVDKVLQVGRGGDF